MQTQRKELNFEGQNIFVGIDTHLKNWKVSVFTDNLHHKTFCQPSNVEALSHYLKLNFPNASYHSVYEAGFCGFWIHNKLLDLGIQNIVVNPADVPTTDKEKSRKTDKIDSNKLGRSLRAKEIEGIYIPSVKTTQDRTLIRTRSNIGKDLVRIKHRIKSMLYFYGIEFPIEFQKSTSHWSKRFLKWLKTIDLKHESGNQALTLLISEAEQLRILLLDATKKIKILSESEQYEENIKLITSVPGVALLTGMLFLSEVEDINRFQNSDKFAGLVGIVPDCHSSGTKENIGEITHRGHNLLRKALIESSWIAVRVDPALSKAYYDYCKRMESNKAIVRIARKLLNRIYSVLKNKKKYEKGIV